MFKAKLFEVDFGKEEAVLNEEDARELGLRAQERVKLVTKRGSTVVIINTTKSFVKKGEIGIFSKKKKELGFKKGDTVEIEHIGVPLSVQFIRKKLDNSKLEKTEINTIVDDIVNDTLSFIDLSAFVSALHVRGMDMEEVEYLTKRMTSTGETLKFSGRTYDKHSLGGVPGDKTTLLVIPIVASQGLIIPKTSSRAITDPAGTADRMEVFAPVDHSTEKIRKIVEKTGACMVWGGAVDLAPADDALIQVEHPLNLDPRPLLLASVMSKKHAVNASYVVIDIPMGPETKVHSYDEARKLARDFIDLGERLKIQVECAITYGAQPVGSSMGPVLEAREALETLRGGGSSSLIEKSTAIAGMLLEASGVAGKNEGHNLAHKILEDGTAYKKFKEIVKAQGGKPNVTIKDLEKRIGKKKFTVYASQEGYVTGIHNRDIASVAKIAGAPYDKGAGAIVHAKGGDEVKKGGELFTIYASHQDKLDKAVAWAKQTKPVVVEGMLLEEIPSTVISRH